MRGKKMSQAMVFIVLFGIVSLFSDMTHEGASSIRGAYLALLGASGCGKSMTLKCIAGIMTPDRGRIVLNDRVLFDSEARIDLPPQQRRVGYLFQNYALFPTMTVEKKYPLRNPLRLQGGKSRRTDGGPPPLSAGGAGKAVSRPAFRRSAAAGGAGEDSLLPAGGHFAGRAVFRAGQLSEMGLGAEAVRFSGEFLRADFVGVP